VKLGVLRYYICYISNPYPKNIRSISAEWTAYFHWSAYWW